MNFTPTCRGWIELPAADIISEHVSIPFCTKPTRQTLKFLLPKRLRLEFLIDLECSKLWSKQHKAITTRLTFCMYASILSTHSRSKPRNSMDRTITVVSSREAATSHRFLVQVYITNYLKLHPLLSWGAYPKPFRKPAHSLKRMTSSSTGRSRHIGSSRSVWWILVTCYLPKLPKLVKAHAVFSDMHDPYHNRYRVLNLTQKISTTLSSRTASHIDLVCHRMLAASMEKFLVWHL